MIDFKRLAVAMYYDAKGEKEKQPLTRKEKVAYHAYTAALFFTIGTIGVYIPNVVTALVANIVCFIIGTRKMWVFWQEKEKWEEEKNKYYNSGI